VVGGNNATESVDRPSRDQDDDAKLALTPTIIQWSMPPENITLTTDGRASAASTATSDIHGARLRV